MPDASTVLSPSQTAAAASTLHRYPSSINPSLLYMISSAEGQEGAAQQERQHGGSGGRCRRFSGYTQSRLKSTQLCQETALLNSLSTRKAPHPAPTHRPCKAAARLLAPPQRARREHAHSSIA